MKFPVQGPWLRWGKRLLTLFFLILLAVLLYMLLRNQDWGEVRQALTAYSGQTLLVGVLLAAASYLLFACYDLLARRYSRHRLPTQQVLGVAMVCYAFNLNFTTWIGGMAMRYRLYMRLGLSASTVTRILSLGLLTNWIGYMALAGSLFALRLVQLPESWALGMSGLQLLGFAMLVLVSAYIGICAFAHQRVWHFGERSITLPSAGMALLQLCLGAANWSLMAALIHWLLPEGATYASVLGVLLISCMAAVVAHIPAGLGVLEAVFLALLQHQYSHASLIAALLVYRVLYYLLPLALASISYLVLEKRARTLRQQGQQSGAREGLPG
ncbi:lysylphosphatidylglycerol synthase domain-containing protein [Pseudomonas sp. GOM7]|uniref:lysylphosphatidylglycerol synthase domain-containing protein n=1 Tax=Pseudomonas sp. GOM7 TaxID=2998079 RepID=UPI00227C4928|nr:lysylphosphatidylglycerol synthase domain-containing protein [Pseudomonas sp. GOM7]WAJ35519.1 lysylphosphatidylglycerol synthase domain-containing protein [Pseudomonas sp. GOM7]